MTSNQMHPHHKSQGLTLVELLVALAMAALLSVALVATFASYSRTQTAQDNIISMQQNLRAALYLMGRDLRMAGYRGDNPATAPKAGVTDAKADSISFSFLNEETGALSTITYLHYDSNADGMKDTLSRTMDADGPFIISEDIDGVEFFYTLDGGGQSTAPATIGSLDDIRSVEITILARTNRDDRNFSNTATYTPASDNSNAPWGTNNDGHRRRMGKSFILFRNM